MKLLFVALIGWMFFLPLSLKGQTTVFTESFSATNNTLATAASPAVSYTSNLGLVGAPAGSASVQTSALQISNGNSGSNTAGLGYVSGSSAGFSSPFSTTLGNNPSGGSKVAWYVNFSNTRTGAVLSASMGSGNYSQAVILACDNANPLASGAKGYGLFLLRSATVSTQNALYLVYFTNGISGVANSGSVNQNILQTTDDLYASGTGGSRYISAKTTFDPATGMWQLASRKEAGAYTIATDETSNYITLSAVANTAGTGIALPYFGFAWGYSTTTGNNGTFDNVTVKIVPPPVVPTISVSKSTLTNFVYITGQGPSAVQTVDVSGLNLSAPVALTAPANYELNNPAVNAVYGSSLTLTPAGGTLASTTINVRLKAGLSAGNYNTQAVILTSTTASQTITCSGLVKNLTNPSPQTLPYSQDFSSFSGSSTTYPVGWQAWEVSANTPNSGGRTTAPDSDKDITGGTAASTGSGAYDFIGKIGFLSSATSDVALALALNTTGKSSIEVNFDAMTIRNLYDGVSNKYIEGIVFQYRIGTSGDFTTLSYTPATYVQNQVLQISGTTGQNLVQNNKAVLPPACNNQAVVQVRRILQATGSGDVRQSFTLDNILVRESPIAPKADYYVDATNGNDASNGTTISTLWQSLTKVNSMIFDAGSHISQNDKGSLIFFNYPSAGNEICNNVFYIGPDTSPTVIRENSRSPHSYRFYNNIISNLSSTAQYRFASGPAIQDIIIGNNLFYNLTATPANQPTEPSNLIADPLFVSPGQATTGLTTVNGYRLLPTSPAINSGTVITDKGSRDFWGNPLYKGGPDIGAHETNAPSLTAAARCGDGVLVLQANCGGIDVPQCTASVVSDTALPTAGLIARGPITCASRVVTLTALGGDTYQFGSLSAGVVSQLGGSATVNAGGLYSVTVTNTSTGCSKIATTTVSSNTTAPVAVLTASPNATLTCAQTFLTLTGGNGASTYIFADPSGILAGSGTTRIVNSAGTYSLTALAGNGCFSVTTVTVTSIISGEPAGVTLPASVSSVCAGSNVNVTASITGATSAYQWYKDGLSLGITQQISTLSLNALQVGQGGSYVLVIVGGACSSVSSNSFT